MTLNTATDDPAKAWQEMEDTYEAQDALKKAAGRSLVGRKNTQPVLHFTLSWHVDDKPSADDMREAALATLKVLGLDEHEAVIAAHKDKKHPHIHVVVNTVHPETGMTAPLNFSKEKLQEWAKEYELARVVRVKERLRKAAEKDRIRQERTREAQKILTAISDKQKLPERIPYERIKHQRQSRQAWFADQAAMDAFRHNWHDLEAGFKADDAARRDRFMVEHAKITAAAKASLKNLSVGQRAAWRSTWSDLYKRQRQVEHELRRAMSNSLDFSKFVHKNRVALGGANGPLTTEQMQGYFADPALLPARVEAIHLQERVALARAVRAYNAKAIEARMATFDSKMDLLKATHALERRRQKMDRQQKREEMARRQNREVAAEAKRLRAETARQEHERRRWGWRFRREVPVKLESEEQILQRIFREVVEGMNAREEAAKKSAAAAPSAKEHFREASKAEPDKARQQDRQKTTEREDRQPTRQEQAQQQAEKQRPQIQTSERSQDVKQSFKQAAEPSQARPTESRADEIKRDMAEWRRRNHGKDHGRER